MKKLLRKGLAVAMALTMVFAMSVSAFADTNSDATLNIYIVDETGTSYQVDTMSVTPGQSVYDAVNALDYYEPVWMDGTDVYDGSATKYLNAYMGYEAVNVDYYYGTDGSGWSKDWGWQYTVNDIMPSFADNPDHGMAMNQYTIQSGDEIDVAYTLTYTEWDANFNTNFEIVYPW